MYSNLDDNEPITIMGCNDGIDWSVTHQKNIVTLESEQRSKAELLFNEYKDIIINFTDVIEDFYGNPNDKSAPIDELDRDAFHKFWHEWKELKNKASI